IAEILLIDDDPDLLDSLADLLEDAGYRVATASSAEEATRALAIRRPDLVLLDLILPDADGLVFCGQLRARDNLPIVICSGSQRRRDSTLARMLGADDFLPKPLEPSVLLAHIEAVLRRVRREAMAAPAAEESHLAPGTDEPALSPTDQRILLMLADRKNR